MNLNLNCRNLDFIYKILIFSQLYSYFFDKNFYNLSIKVIDLFLYIDKIFFISIKIFIFFKKMQIAIILPAYNEALSIKNVILDFHKACPKAKIYVIDNNSSDNTSKIAKKTFKDFNINGKILSEKKQGKANAIKKAFYEIDADIYVMADADLTYLAKDLPKLIKPIIENEADMVVGDRISNKNYKKINERRFHNFGNFLITFFINIAFSTKIKDVSSGYRIMNKKFVKNYPILASGFELEADMTMHTLDKNMKMLEIPIEYNKRQNGSFSKLNTVSDGFRVIFTIFQLFRCYKTLKFFCVISLFLILLSFISGYQPIMEYINAGFIDSVPRTILASGLMIIAGISFSIGLILNAIAQNNRHNYELRIIDFYEKK